MMRAQLALITYWTLFIFAPLVAFIAWRGWSVITAILVLVLFLALGALGERGFRLWKRLWKIS